jgi:hypothetical protein
MSSESKTSQHKHLDQWYLDNILRGDTRHPFIGFLPKELLPELSRKAVDGIFTCLEGMKENNSWYKEIVAFYSPWPGFVKYHERVIDHCSFYCWMDEAVFNRDEFKKAYIADGGTNKYAITQMSDEEAEASDDEVL